MTQEQIEAAREWLHCCFWPDLDSDGIDALADREVIDGIRRHYSGGIAQFIRDGE